MAGSTNPVDKIIQALHYRPMQTFTSHFRHSTLSRRISGKPCCARVVSTGEGRNLLIR